MGWLYACNIPSQKSRLERIRVAKRNYFNFEIKLETTKNDIRLTHNCNT